MQRIQEIKEWIYPIFNPWYPAHHSTRNKKLSGLKKVTSFYMLYIHLLQKFRSFFFFYYILHIQTFSQKILKTGSQPMYEYTFQTKHQLLKAVTPRCFHEKDIQIMQHINRRTPRCDQQSHFSEITLQHRCFAINLL